MGFLDNIGIGADIQEIAEFSNYNHPKNRAFYERVFHEGERAYCLSTASPAQHLAARFAAKEAIIKAISRFKTLSFEQIEIEHDENQRPVARLHVEDSDAYRIHVSLTHSDSQAVAIAVLEKEFR